MKTTIHSLLLNAGLASHLALVDLDAVDAVQLARALPKGPQQLHPQFLINCDNLVCQRTLGVSHVVSQLLVLRKAGASIWLRNVNAPLRHCLHLLQLGPLFNMVTAE